MAELKIHQVKMPDGEVVFLEGPVGSSQEEMQGFILSERQAAQKPTPSDLAPGINAERLQQRIEAKAGKPVSTPLLNTIQTENKDDSMLGAVGQAWSSLSPGQQLGVAGAATGLGLYAGYKAKGLKDRFFSPEEKPMKVEIVGGEQNLPSAAASAEAEMQRAWSQKYPGTDFNKVKADLGLEGVKLSPSDYTYVEKLYQQRVNAGQAPSAPTAAPQAPAAPAPEAPVTTAAPQASAAPTTTAPTTAAPAAPAKPALPPLPEAQPGEQAMTVRGQKPVPMSALTTPEAIERAKVVLGGDTPERVLYNLNLVNQRGGIAPWEVHAILGNQGMPSNKNPGTFEEPIPVKTTQATPAPPPAETPKAAVPPTTEKPAKPPAKAPKAKVEMPEGWGKGMSWLTTVHGQEGAQAFIDQYNNGKPFASHQEMEKVYKEVTVRPKYSDIPKDIRKERGIIPRAALMPIPPPSLQAAPQMGGGGGGSLIRGLTDPLQLKQ